MLRKIENPNLPINIIQSQAENTKPLLLEEVKLFLRIDNNYDDTLLNRLIDFATIRCESQIEKILMRNEYKAIYLGDRKNLKIQSYPLEEILEVKITYKNLPAVIISSDKYTFNYDTSILTISEENIHKIEVKYMAGIASNSNEISQDIKQAILLDVANLYENKVFDATKTEAICSKIYGKYRNINI